MSRLASRNIKTLSVLTLGLVLTVAGLLIYALPGGFALEENVALDFLFKLRGYRAPPAQVMLVSIDKTSAQQLGLSNDPQTWPREYHARLIERLAEAGAAVIVFDIFFQQPRSVEQDARLADAMRRAGNVVVFSRLEREVQSISGSDAYNLERLVPPTAVIFGAAAATAPFALPKVPIKVNQFWTFHTSAGDPASLPTAALELYAAQDHDRLRQVVDERLPQQAALLREAIEDLGKRRPALLRAICKQHPALTRELLGALQEDHALAGDVDASRRLQALLAVYQGADRRYLNFYGPPRTIATAPYPQVLDPGADLAAFKNKVVFVGFSEERQPEQKDSFYTVYSQQSGLDLSGVEIAATAFANLLAQDSLRLPGLWAYLALLMLYGFALASLNLLSSTRLFVVLSVALAALYTLLCLQAFAAHAYWLPLFIPVLVQTPLAVFLVLAWRHKRLKRERAQIRKAFGYYLPDHVVEDLARDAHRLGAPSERMYGVCLATDAAQYTQLAETLAPEELAARMNAYYARLFQPVRARGGIISDVVGDAMLAIWSARTPERRLRQQACMAALEALRADAAPGQEPGLRTRLGLHAGEIMLGNIGALDHYEYRAVGDIVNTASRIEGLNKLLGTSLLVSAEVLADLDGFVSRELGTFRLAGKRQAIVIHELLGLEGHCGDHVPELCRHFTQGLRAYRQGDCAAAERAFQRALGVAPEDGPSRFFLRRCELHAQSALSWPIEGVIVLQQK